jgi:hypothetical protein
MRVGLARSTTSTSALWSSEAWTSSPSHPRPSPEAVASAIEQPDEVEIGGITVRPPPRDDRASNRNIRRYVC